MGRVQGRDAEDILDRCIRSDGEQRLDHRRILVPSRRVQGRLSEIVPRLDVGPGSEQHADHRRILVQPRREMQGRFIEAAPRRGIGPAGKAHFHVPDRRRLEERSEGPLTAVRGRRGRHGGSLRNRRQGRRICGDRRQSCGPTRPGGLRRAAQHVGLHGIEVAGRGRAPGGLPGADRRPRARPEQAIRRPRVEALVGEHLLNQPPRRAVEGQVELGGLRVLNGALLHVFRQGNRRGRRCDLDSREDRGNEKRLGHDRSIAKRVRISLPPPSPHPSHSPSAPARRRARRRPGCRRRRSVAARTSASR